MQEKQSSQEILFLTDEQLRLGVEAMFLLIGVLPLTLIKFLKNTHMAVLIIVHFTLLIVIRKQQLII